MKKFDPEIFMRGVCHEAGEKPTRNIGIRHVRSLLQVKGESFINQAYCTILGRAPDPEGLAAYSGQAQTTLGRFLIIAALYFSPERVWLPPWQRSLIKWGGKAIRVFRRSQ